MLEKESPNVCILTAKKRATVVIKSLCVLSSYSFCCFISNNLGERFKYVEEKYQSTVGILRRLMKNDYCTYYLHCTVYRSVITVIGVTLGVLRRLT